jgi:hypothetical protein
VRPEAAGRAYRTAGSSVRFMTDDPFLTHRSLLVSSEQIHGVGRDAAHFADAIAARRGKSRPDRPVANLQDQLDSGGSQAYGERRSR